MLVTYFVVAAGILSGPSLANPVSSRAIECTFNAHAEAGDTCDTLASSWAISVDELKGLNPGIDCSGTLPAGAEYCVEGTGAEPIPTTTTTTTPTQEQITTTTTSKSPEETCYKNAPKNVQPGTVCGCDKWHLVQKTTTCEGIISYDKITAGDFYRWNPQIGGEACTGLWLNYSVCVHGPNAHKPPTTTTSAKPPQNTCYKNAPKNVQPGTVCGCDKWHAVGDTSTCEGIIKHDKINADDFYKWNPKIGGRACTGLWKGYSVCVHGPGAHKPSNPPPSPCYKNPPKPVQPGATCKCKKWHKVGDKTTCAAIIKYEKIKSADFYKWNPKVGGSSCSGLWKGYYVCVGV